MTLIEKLEQAAKKTSVDNAIVFLEEGARIALEEAITRMQQAASWHEHGEMVDLVSGLLRELEAGR